MTGDLPHAVEDWGKKHGYKVKNRLKATSKLKLALAGTIAICILVFSFIGYSIGASSFSRNIYAQDWPSTATYVIRSDGAGTYWAVKNDGSVPYNGTSKDTVTQSAIDSLTSGGTIYLDQLQLGTVTYGNSIFIIEDYQGQLKLYSKRGTFLIPQLASDPSTSGWGVAETGRMWLLNTTGTVAMKYWNGTAVVTLSTGATGSQGPAGPAGTGGISTATFIITTNSTATYSWFGANSTLHYSSTNASAVINAALGNLTSGRNSTETVWVKGNFTITNSILIASYTHFILDGRITLADSSNCNMIQQYTTSEVRFIDIEGGIYDGNRQNQASGDIIHLETSGAEFYEKWHNKIHDIQFYRAKTYAVYLKGIWAISTYNLYIHDADVTTDKYWRCTNGIYLESVPDSLFHNIHCATVSAGIAITIAQYCPSNKFTDCYFGGSKYGVYASGTLTENLLFDNCIINDCGEAGYYFNEVNQSSIRGGRCADNAWNGEGVYSDVILAGSSSYNIISNIEFREVSPNHKAKYGVEEQDSANYNVVVGCIATGQITAGFHTIGANTKVAASYNGTTWIP